MTSTRSRRWCATTTRRLAVVGRLVARERGEPVEPPADRHGYLPDLSEEETAQVLGGEADGRV
ncbi:hypothetical protein [Saccharothrix syringae]|uniref:Uncharacterized protein n=1 Tax=Saccharothrix syringae TaxID=103733 RepID=A0A5Q0H633_SACSY|nr:hypothetical protein [Saccharothrix syringae]QFZ21320.1 hypothetical protein EKG83_31535 [Saccharothrix syringae]